jgi:poly(3-hydroxyalkanoate) synthetase
VTFVLTNGGHNAGIVNPPGNTHRNHQIATHTQSQIYVDPDTWQASAVHHEGSWWPCWSAWLVTHSAVGRVPHPCSPSKRSSLSAQTARRLERNAGIAAFLHSSNARLRL